MRWIAIILVAGLAAILSMPVITAVYAQVAPYNYGGNQYGAPWCPWGGYDGFGPWGGTMNRGMMGRGMMGGDPYGGYNGWYGQEYGMGPSMMGGGCPMHGGPYDGYSSAVPQYQQGQVTIVNNGYQPRTITMDAGSTVTWVNLDFVPHTVTAGTPSQPTGLFDSELIDQGESFQYTFTEPGVYFYFCEPHPWMTGRVIVR